MAASLDDILTTQKNGVVAINGLNQSLLSIVSLLGGTPLASGAMGTSLGTIATVPSGRQYGITDIEICNSGVATTFSIYLVPSGGTAGSSNALFYNAPISPNMTVQWTGVISLAAGSTIQAVAGTANLSIRVTGASL